VLQQVQFVMKDGVVYKNDLVQGAAAAQP